MYLHILFIIGILFSLNCVAQNPVYKKYTVEDGLPSNEIYQLTQDGKGYIWLATSQGASRFNGSRFENFTIENGLPDNDILFITEDKQGRIWFKSFTGPLTFYDGTVHNSSNTPWLKKLEFTRYVSAFTPLYHGDILICGNEIKTLLLSDTTVSVYDSVYSVSMIQRRDSSVLQITANGVFENGKPLSNLNLFPSSQKQFFSYYNKLQDILLIRNDAGLFALQQHKLTRINQSLTSTDKGCVIVADNEGYFWLTDFNNLHRLKLDSNTQIAELNKYFDGIVINNVLQDKDNNFWFATKGEGLLMVPSLSVKLFNKISGLQDNNVLSALRMSDGKIICGTMNGYLETIDEQGKIAKLVNLDSTPVRKIIDDRNSGAYILTQRAVFHKHLQGIKKLFASGVANKSIALSSAGEVVIGGYAFYTKYTNGKLNSYRIGIGGEFRVYSIGERVPNEVWLGTEKGLFIFKNDSLLPFHAELKPFKGWIDDISKTQDGTMLVTTRDSGLAIIANNKIDFINTTDGLQSNTCTALYYDSLSRKIFLGLNTGLSVINFQNNIPSIQNYNSTSGLLCSSIFSISENKGEILLSTEKGLLIFNEKDFSSGVEAPKVYITNLEINNTAVLLMPDYDLSYRSNNIRIVYEGISFRHPKSLEYRYRLSPDDNDWSITKSRTVVYPALPPGCYKFLVQVRSGNGQWMNQNSSFCFTIHKPYWATWWFRILSALLFIAVVYGVYRYQLKRKLEQHLAIAADRARISSEMHDDLGSGLSKISMLSDMISTNTSSADMKPHLENISRSSKEMVDKMGDIIWSMNVKNDQIANLIAYTRKYAMEFFETTSIRCVVILPELIPNVNIEGSARRNIFLVVKEGLHNVLKHSAAETVTIKFDTTPHTLTITIHDNGKGIDATKLSAFGNGLINMQKRMNDTAGEFSIKNENGTILKISVPI